MLPRRKRQDAASMPAIPDFSAAKNLLAVSIELTFAAKSGRCNLRTQGWCHSEFHLGVVPQITYNQPGRLSRSLPQRMTFVAAALR
jgi:hypothetical protein